MMDFKKLLSGQWLMVVMTCFTYCAIVLWTTVYYVKHASGDKLEGFAMGLIMGFASTAGMVYKAYFDRERPGTSATITTTGNSGKMEEVK